MRVRIRGAGPVSGAIEIPGDKSIGHRALMMAALASGTTRIERLGPGQDLRSSVTCLRALGVHVHDEGERVEVDSPGRERWGSGERRFDAGNSGTTARFLMGMLAPCLGLSASITGDGSLSRRPMARVARPLSSMGARIQLSENATLPARIEGEPLVGRRIRLPVPSAQVKTALLFAGLGAEGETWIENGAGRDHTERMLPLFGASIRRDAQGSIGVTRTSLTSPVRVLRIPGDPSSAMFFAVAAVITRGRVRMESVCLNPTRTAAFDALGRMGAEVRRSNVREEVDLSGDLEVEGELSSTLPIELCANDLIDEVPVLAVAAACRPHGATTRFLDGAELRVKESDRLRATVDGLRAMGARVDEQGDSFCVHGGELRGATIDSSSDHRIAMAFSVAALGAKETTVIEGAEWAAVSLPGFHEMLARLGAEVEQA